jgi:hypothetical protein
MGKIDILKGNNNTTSTKKMGNGQKRGRKPRQIKKSTKNPLEIDEETNTTEKFDVFVNIPYTNKNDDEQDSESESDDDNGIIYYDQPKISECTDCTKLKDKIRKMEKQAHNLLSKYYLPDDHRKANYSNVKMVGMDGDKMKIKSKTKFVCFYEGEHFDNVPGLLVEDMRNGVYQIRNDECFCSPNCALAYNLYMIKDGYTQRRHILTTNFYREVFQIDIGKPFEIRLAPPLKKRKNRGGDMTIEEFRKDSMIVNKEYLVYYPPSAPIDPILMEQAKPRI